jgi:hypothetical protein
MVSFTDPQRGCTRTIDTGWLKYPCAHTKPCPIHGRKPHPEPQSDNLGPGEHWFAESFVNPKGGSRATEDQLSPFSTEGAPAGPGAPSVPAPRLFEEAV